MSTRYQSLRKALNLFDLLVGDDFQSKATLASSLGIEPRTVKGYIDVLEEFGWPIERSGKGFRLSDVGAAARFTEADLLLVAILLAQGSSTLPAAEFERLSTKLVSLLPQPSVTKVRELHDKVEQIGGRSGEIHVLTCIGRCLSDPHYQLVADYQKSDDEQPQRRQLLPLKLRYQKESWYIDCHDLEKNGFRSFRVDRFLSVQLLRQDQPIPHPDPACGSSHKWDFGHEEPVEVTIEATERLAKWLEQNPEHDSQQILSQDGSWLISYRVRKLEFFVDWVLGLRGAKPVHPPALLETVEARCRAFLETGGTLGVEWG